ncbi:hypothetical protein WKV44_03365 [Spirochaetia bacterium 38H-sp]|uniref:Adenylate/guanylate cyclase domain-containing protein n=1 Tax=Rarispira pelagica TaxID=3141764 RepID=A0ABU9UA84_9SPIR
MSVVIYVFMAFILGIATGIGIFFIRGLRSFLLRIVPIGMDKVKNSFCNTKREEGCDKQQEYTKDENIDKKEEDESLRSMDSREAVILYMCYKEAFRLFKDNPLNRAGRSLCSIVEEDYARLYNRGASCIFDMGTEACAIFDNQNAALKACTAALSLQKKEEGKLNPSIGITHGKALIAEIKTASGRNSKVLGEDVFTARELAYAATEGNIILSRDFYNSVKETVIAEGPQNLKYKDREGFSRVFILKGIRDNR